MRSGFSNPVLFTDFYNVYSEMNLEGFFLFGFFPLHELITHHNRTFGQYERLIGSQLILETIT